MKKLYFFVSAFITGLTLNAQLTQANHAPTAGDTYQMWQCDSVAPGAGGASMVWNYASINTHSSVLVTKTASASTNAMFPSATVSVNTAPNNLVSYYSSSTSSLSYFGGNIMVGSGSSAVAATLIYTAAAINASYPMSFNTTGSAAIGGSLNVTSPISTSGTFTGSSTTLADGTGTLILPGATGTFTNVMRVVSSQTINFTTSLASGSLFQSVYEYYISGTKAPIFSIATATANTPLGTATQTLVQRNKNAVGTGTTTSTVGIVSVEANPVSLSVYPNPSSDLVNINSTYANANAVVIYDVTGKQVEKIKLIDGKAKLDVTSYNKGLYIYTLISDDGKRLKTGKLTVGE